MKFPFVASSVYFQRQKRIVFREVRDFSELYWLVHRNPYLSSFMAYEQTSPINNAVVKFFIPYKHLNNSKHLKVLGKALGCYNFTGVHRVAPFPCGIVVHQGLIYRNPLQILHGNHPPLVTNYWEGGEPKLLLRCLGPGSQRR